MILKWEKFLEKWSYPESIKGICDIVYSECVRRIDEFNGDDIYSEIINISYSELKHLRTNNTFSQFPVESIQVALNLIGSDPDYYKGSFHSIKQSKEEAGQEYSYLVGNGIFLRLSFAVGINEDIDKTKLDIKQLINHEVQHGYDQYNQIVNNKSYNDEYYFYRTILYFIEEHSEVLSNDAVEFLLAIYNCSETEMKSIMAEPGEKFNTKEWKNVLGKRDLHNIDIDAVAHRMKKERNISTLPEVLGGYYTQICELGGVGISEKFVKICRKDYDSFIDYWVPVIKRKMDTIKRKTAKRIVKESHTTSDIDYKKNYRKARQITEELKDYLLDIFDRYELCRTETYSLVRDNVREYFVHFYVKTDMAYGTAENWDIYKKIQQEIMDSKRVSHLVSSIKYGGDWENKGDSPIDKIGCGIGFQLKLKVK